MTLKQSYRRKMRSLELSWRSMMARSRPEDEFMMRNGQQIMTYGFLFSSRAIPLSKSWTRQDSASVHATDIRNIIISSRLQRNNLYYTYMYLHYL